MAVTSFIPELWNARLLYALEKNHVATALVNRDYEGEIKNYGDTVHINTIGAINVSTYSAGTPITVQDLATTDQTLDIDQQKYFAFKVDDIDKVQAAGNLIDVAAGRAAYALTDTSDAFILGKIATAALANSDVVGSAGTPVTLTKSNVYEKIVDLRTLMDKKNVPLAGRSIVIPPEVYALLLQDDRFTKNDVTAEQTTVNGYVGRVAGFDVYESNNVTTGSGYFVITAQIPDATSFAEQLIKTEAFRPEGSFADAVKGLHVYGCKVTKPAEIVGGYYTV